MENLPRPIALISLVITLGLGISWGLAEYDYLTVDPKLFEPLLTVFGAITAIAGIFVLSGTKSTEDTELPSNRDLLIEAVQNNWIDDGKRGGFLQDALRDATIQVDFTVEPDKAGDSTHYKDYEIPINLVERDGDSRDNIQHTSDVVRRIFEQVNKKLLILGEGGTGKTVLLLQLTEILLEEARETNTPIPVVFNLASWAEERASLTDWLKQRFKIEYGVNDKLATELIAGDNLIYCLDGFDEVAEDYREECLHELNTFMTPTRQVVICSRIKAYDELAQLFDTKYAIEVQPLTDEQFTKLLVDNIPHPSTVEKILKTLKDDSEVWQEIKKPLFVNILINTYADGRDFPEQNIEGTTRQKVYQLIIDPYVIRQLQNKKPPHKELDNAVIPRYLAWIAHNLNEREQIIFYIEMLQGHWLPNNNIIVNFRKITGFIIGGITALIVGSITIMIFEIIFSTKLGIIIGVVIGLADWIGTSILVGLIDIELNKHFTLNLTTLKKQMKQHAILEQTIIAIILFTAIVTLVTNLKEGFWFGITIFFISIIINGTTSEKLINYNIHMNQGFMDTAKISINLGLVVALIVGISISMIIDKSIGIIVGIGVGCGAAFGLGLSDIILHIILRLMLENQNLAPRRYDKFLEHVIERRIMRRVGGSAVFIHRYVLEYFAQEWQDKYASEFET